MENTHRTLRLYVPVSERICVSPPLSHGRGPAPPFKAPLKPQQGLTSNCREEGPAEALQQGQEDRFGLTDLKETLEALDDFSDIRWLTELLPLCLECQAFMSMGNQQGTKCHGYAESRDDFPKSPRFQIPRKRRRRVEGLVYSSQHNLKMTPGTPRVPLKARRLMKLRITSSSTFGEWDLEDGRRIMCTPAARKKRATGSPQELKPALRVKLPDASSPSLPFCKKGLFSSRNYSSVNKESALPDSDTDLSEYDNDMYSTYISSTRKTDGKVQITKAEGDTDQEKQAEGVEKSSRWMLEEMGKTAAAQRVIGKIEEVEGIIRRVSLTSSDWIREGGDGRDEAQFISDGAQFGSQLETQNKGCNEDKPLLVEELQALGEALSQSLRQVLKMEGAKAEIKTFTEVKKTSCEPDFVGSTRRPLNLSSNSHHFTSAMPNSSSPPSLSPGAENFPVPSVSLSAILDVSQRTSTCFEDTSPIMSPLLSSNQHYLPRSLTDQHEKEISDHHTRWISTIEDSLFPQCASGYGSVATNSSGTGNEPKKSGTTLTQTNLRLSEQNQRQTSRRTSETEANQDDLLSSDEALQRQEEIWQQEVEESLSFCRALSHPSRPKHIDFLRITAAEDDIIDTPTTTPLPPEFRRHLSKGEMYQAAIEQSALDVGVLEAGNVEA